VPHPPEPKFANVTLAQQVYAHLRQGILENAYPPAAPLPEEALAARLNVSRVPVREALRRLAAEGLVTLVPRQGAVVSSLSRKQFLDAYRLRGALEALAVRLAIPQLTADDLDRLAAIDATMKTAAAAHDPEAFFAANAAFHAIFIDRAGNDYLRATYEPLMDQMRRYRSPSADLRGGLERSIEEHEAILAAVRAGDAAEASRLISEHIAVPQRILEAHENDEIPLREPRLSAVSQR
jgi:DNA-binding GntR family transcriptional regulator